jgi:hypothetical protein
MKKIYSSFLLLAVCTSYGQTIYGSSAVAALLGNPTPVTTNYGTQSINETCNTIVVNDTDEQNGSYISGAQGQKAAVDISIDATQIITITGLKLILTSLEVPTYAHLRFYNGTMSEANEEDGTAASLIPYETLFDVEDTEITDIVEVAYLSMQNMYVREITLTLATPIVLTGSEVDGRYWMGVLSDANAWGTTAHYDTGVGVVGQSLAMGSNNSDWFQLINLEGLYEMTAECTTATAGVATLTANNRSALFPNPVKDAFTVTVPSQSIITGTEIFSVSGQKIKEIAGGAATINVSGLAQGMYIVKTHTGNITYTDKFIKQ